MHGHQSGLLLGGESRTTDTRVSMVRLVLLPLFACVFLSALARFVLSDGHYEGTFKPSLVRSGLRNVADIREGITVAASSVERFVGPHSALSHPAYAFDGDVQYAWVPDGKDRKPWIHVSFAAARRIESIRVSAFGANEFTVRCLSGREELAHTTGVPWKDIPLRCEAAERVEIAWSEVGECVRRVIDYGAEACISPMSAVDIVVNGQ